ncbi:amino acid ABC transporter permease [Nocardioides sp.]|uniref:amino acid ABC transporter permease n=1 Tax=Nocardioides sp. TaxID=35761 RepID=UPI0037836F08
MSESAGAWQPSAREQERRDVRRSLRRRGILVSTTATVVFFGLVVLGTITSPGWPAVKEYFFNPSDARAAFPSIWHAFWTYNVKLFLLGEVLILALALVVALVRQSRSPLMLPLRIVAVVYTDLFRGIPTILLVFILALGMPALQLQGVPTSLFFWGLVALVLSYGAYVAEVIRAGIESIHPSQIASADALGLSRLQAMRHVVVPQGIRRVVPPLLNDFISLQKDTALVGVVGVFDAMFAAQDYSNYNFNFTAFTVVACYFIVLTVPLARFTDHLQRRAMERERQGAR